MNSLLLIGAGGHSHACIDVIEQAREYNIVGIIDQHPHDKKKVLGYPVLGSDEMLSDIRKTVDTAFVSVGQIKDASIRVRLYEKLCALKFNLPVIISPHAYVAPDAQIGAGSIIMHGAIVNRGAVIGDNVIINTRALVEHDARIGSHTHISTGAIINGGARVGQQAFIGSLSVVVQACHVPDQYFLRSNQLFHHPVPAL